jgi:hypothetical protein
MDRYGGVLDECAVMLLPAGLVLDDEETILRSLSGPPWESYSLNHLTVLEPTRPSPSWSTPSGPRAGVNVPVADVSSTDISRVAGWKLALHQQILPLQLGRAVLGLRASAPTAPGSQRSRAPSRRLRPRWYTDMRSGEGGNRENAQKRDSHRALHVRV